MSATSTAGLVMIPPLYSVLVKRGKTQAVEWIHNALQMRLRYVEISGRSPEVPMPQHFLDGPQIRAVLKHMGGKRMADKMGRDSLFDAGPTGGHDAGIINGLVRDWHVLTIPTLRARKQVISRLFPTPILTQGVKQYRTERNKLCLAPLAAFNMDHHAGTIYVAGLQHGKFPAYPVAVQR
jgi:hypothetical protein